MQKFNFSRLNNKDQALLIAIFLFDRKEMRSLLRHVDGTTQKVLAEPAQLLGEYNHELRIQLLVEQLKILLRQETTSIWNHIEPSWVAAAIAEESLEMQQLILSLLPRSLIIALGVPSISCSQVPKEAGELILSLLANKFHPMPQVNIFTDLGLEHLLLLSFSDLLVLCERLGQQKNYHDSRHISMAAVTLDQLTLVECGLITLAQAVTLNQSLNIQHLAQRLPINHGKKLLEYAKLFPASSGYSELAGEIVSLVVELSQNKLIDQRFSRFACT